MGWGTVLFFFCASLVSRDGCARALCICFGLWGLSAVSCAVSGDQVWAAPGVMTATGGRLVEALHPWRPAVELFMAKTCTTPLYVLLATLI